MTFLRKIFSVLVIIGAGLVFISVTGYTASLSPSLEKLIYDSEDDDSLVSIIIFMQDDTGSKMAKKAASMPAVTLKARHKQVVEILQSEHLSMLEGLKQKVNNIYRNANIKEFWITPAVALEIPVSKIVELVDFPGVASIVEDAQIELIEPIESISSAVKTSGARSHLTSLNVPALWNRGLTFDTGVEGSHPALQSKWRGNHTTGSAAWFAPSSSYTYPFDISGHGTHTMGLMVGSFEADSFGVAPNAEWISAAVIDQGQTLSKTFSDILAAFQWAVDPDGNPSTVDDMPDVILNSWGVPTSILGPCDATFNQAIDNVEAAGIVTIFAAGNEGPTPKSLRLPANRATSPLNTISVGAIDGTTNVIANFSSRGPSSCDDSQIKPELVAPGVSVYSSAKGGGYLLKSGTSMAAPLIAGLVALLRQYNPDATVDEIKNAIIQSAHDLGPVGEDNDYGYGLPDAEAALAYMPAPPFPQISIANQIITGDGFADLGESFNFYVEFEIVSGNVEYLEAYLECSNEAVEIINDYSLFILEQKSRFSTNINPYVVKFNEPLINGQMIPFIMRVFTPYDTICDTIDLQIMVGHKFDGNMITHVTSDIQLTVTDYGQFGMGQKSIYPVGGAGFIHKDSENLLYEAGIIVGRNPLQLSSSIRDSLGEAYHSEFTPVEELVTVYPDIDGGFRSVTTMTDTQSGIAIPITVNQSISSYNDAGNDDYVIYRYSLINNSNDNINNLYFGFITDFDLSSIGDRLGILTENNMLFQTGDSHAVGLLPLSENSSFLSVENDENKSGFTSQQKYDFISQEGNSVNDSLPGDYMTVVSFGPYNMAPNDSLEICFALIAGDDIAALQLASLQAADRFNISTAVEDDNDKVVIPQDFQLYQNYPNPFNPSTTISFSLDRKAPVKLTIVNVLGQEITTLFNDISYPGQYDIKWDGTDKYGEIVASGIYFYKLQTDITSQTRKMLLLK